MLQTTVQNFQDADTMLDHYAAIRARLGRPAPEAPVVVLRRAAAAVAPPKPPAAVVTWSSEPDSERIPTDLTEFQEQISCGKLLASQANGFRLAKLLEAKYRLPHDSLRGRKRSKAICAARQEWCWILVCEWRWPYSQTGRYLGLDHTTVMHAVARHAALRKSQVDAK